MAWLQRLREAVQGRRRRKCAYDVPSPKPVRGASQSSARSLVLVVEGKLSGRLGLPAIYLLGKEPK